MGEIFVTGMMPVLALRGLTIYPEQTVHFDIGRIKSALALEDAMKKDQTLLLIPQKNIVDDDPGLSELYPIGTVVKVKQILKTQGENIRVLVTGQYRARLVNLTQSEPFLAGIVETAPVAKVADSLKKRALRREANMLYGNYVELTERPAQTVQLRLMASESCGFIADTIAQNSGFDYPERQSCCAS